MSALSNAGVGKEIMGPRSAAPLPTIIGGMSSKHAFLLGPKFSMLPADV